VDLVEVEEDMQKNDREGVEAHQNYAASSGSSDGAASLV
jgi:hypothetical protein